MQMEAFDAGDEDPSSMAAVVVRGALHPWSPGVVRGEL
jgi:hypothetical protein